MTVDLSKLVESVTRGLTRTLKGAITYSRVGFIMKFSIGRFNANAILTQTG